MELTDKLANLLGPGGWLTDSGDTQAFTRDWLDRYGVSPLGVARPDSTRQTAEVVRLCHAHATPVVPQGGGTGLVGASVAENSAAVLLSMSRLNSIELIDADDYTAVVGAGVVLEQLHQALSVEGLAFPLHLGAQGSAQIGGLIATNAGGSHALRYGTMQDLVLGMEVVLPGGEVWKGARRLLKDNAGFQLRKLFCGSEGRLGIVTRAVLKLFPAPANQTTALVALADLPAALQLARTVRSTAAEFLTALEFFDDDILGLALQNIDDLSWPMDSRAPVYLLIELATSVEAFTLDELLENALGDALESGQVVDAVLAQSETQRAALWRIREELPEGSLREGRQLKHDIAVPIARIPAFLASCSGQIDAILPGIRIWTFGHLGDGNIHYNLSPPLAQTDFGGREEDISQAIYTQAEAQGGTLAAEHGLGRSKLAMADRLRSPVERQLMVKIQRAIDEKNLMNPGVVVD